MIDGRKLQEITDHLHSLYKSKKHEAPEIIMMLFCMKEAQLISKPTFILLCEEIIPTEAERQNAAQIVYNTALKQKKVIIQMAAELKEKYE